MTAGADKPARLKSTFHGSSPSDSNTRRPALEPGHYRMRLYRKLSAASQLKGPLHKICNIGGLGAE